MEAEISDVDQGLAATLDRVDVMTWAMSNRCVRGDPGYYLLAILDEDQVVTIGQEVVVCAAKCVLLVLSRSFRDVR